MPKKLKTWMKLPIFGRWAMALTLLLPVFSVAQAQEEDMEELEAFVMTGSRIPRLDIVPVNPVTVITSEALQSTGFSTVGDAIRALPIISGQSLVSVDAGTSFTPGVSSVNLRGLGNNNTLALINGRRIVPFATPGFNGFQQVVDVSSIPSEAIRSLEVLRDGASAIYGSDAVAGVININLADAYEGLSTELSIGNTFHKDSFERSFFAIGGSTTGKLSMVFSVSAKLRNSIHPQDFASWVGDADLSGYDTGDFAWAWDNRSSASVSANVRGLDPDAYLDANGNRLFPNGQAVWAGSRDFLTPSDLPAGPLSVDDFRAGNFFYNYQEATGFWPKTSLVSFYTMLNYQFTDTIRGYLEASFSRSETTIGAAPAPLFSMNENGDGPGRDPAGIIMPAHNPFNPFGVDLRDFRWRILQAGLRDNIVQADVPRIVAGFKGDLGFGDWTFDTAFLYSKSTVTNENGGTVFDSLLQNALNGVNIGGELLYANPFGYTDPRVIDYFSGKNPTIDSFELWSLDFSAGGTLVEGDVVSVLAAVGAELRSESLNALRTVANETGDIVGGSEGSSSAGDRDVKSVYAELRLPVGTMFEAQLAMRHEDYSDFGTTTKPKVAARFQPFDWMLVRGSYGESFRAPDLPLLYSTRSVSFTPSPQVDPLRPTASPEQIRTIGRGNPDLSPEETDVYYAGIVLEAGRLWQPLEGLSFEADYFEFQQKDVITRFSATFINARAGDPFWDQFIVRDAPNPNDIELGQPGQRLYIITDWDNRDKQTYKGWDFAAQYLWNTTHWGDFRFRLEGTYLSEFNVYDGFSDTVTGFAGDANFPRFRGNGRVSWRHGDWAASLFIDYVGQYKQLYADWLGDENQQVDAYWRVNPQVAYAGLWGTTITFGVRNVFNKRPPIDFASVTSINESVHNPEPRFWYLRVSKSW